MHLFELAYCCRLFAEAVGDDSASDRFREATGGSVDLGEDAHRGLLLRWLRAWGCRSLRREDDRRCRDALEAWWEEWRDSLPGPTSTLDALDDDALDAAAHAFAGLAQRVGPRRQSRERLIDVRFGATAAAKAMYAIRPAALLPWDDGIRRGLGYGSDAEGYRRALTRARAALNSAAKEAGVTPSELPALLGRPRSTPPKLIDEHDLVRYTAGHEPPSRDELERWLAWAAIDTGPFSD